MSIVLRSTINIKIISLIKYSYKSRAFFTENIKDKYLMGRVYNWYNFYRYKSKKT